MAVYDILIEPSPTLAGSLQAAYRPIYFKVSAQWSGFLSPTTFIPPVVYCDIYFDEIFYKTLSKTQYINQPDYAIMVRPEYEFDISDACQEYLRSKIPPNGYTSSLPMIGAFTECYCKFRASSINDYGFIDPDSPIPVQGTGNKSPQSGSGLLSFPFYVVNASLQHEHNQDLATHLSYQKKNLDYDKYTYPLTHRSSNYRICKTDSDYFPIAHTYVNAPAKLCIYYRKKGESSFTKLCKETPCAEPKNITITAKRNPDLTTQTITFSWDPLPIEVTAVNIIYRKQGTMGGVWDGFNAGSPVSPRSIVVPLGLYEVMISSAGACGTFYTTPFNNIGTNGLPSLIQTSNVVITIGLFTRIRRQEFQVGKFVTPNNRFQLIVYGITVEIKAVAGDTPITIAQKLAAKVNATSYPIFRAPYKITASSTNDIVKLELDYQHEFVGVAYET